MYKRKGNKQKRKTRKGCLHSRHTTTVTVVAIHALICTHVCMSDTIVQQCTHNAVSYPLSMWSKNNQQQQEHSSQVSVSDFLTLFSARVHSFFWKSMPSLVLLGAAALSLIISTVLACFWPTMTLDGIEVEGLVRGSYKLWPLWVWIYCIIFWLFQVRVVCHVPCVCFGHVGLSSICSHIARLLCNITDKCGRR